MNSLTSNDVVTLFNKKLLAEHLTTTADIATILDANQEYLANSRKRIKKYPLLLPSVQSANAPRYRFRDVEAWVIDVIILLIQQGKIQEVAR